MWGTVVTTETSCDGKGGGGQGGGGRALWGSRTGTSGSCCVSIGLGHSWPGARLLLAPLLAGGAGADAPPWCGSRTVIPLGLGRGPRPAEQPESMSRPRFCGRLGRSPSRVPCSACTPSQCQGAGLRDDVTEQPATPAPCVWPLREHAGWGGGRHLRNSDWD